MIRIRFALLVAAAFAIFSLGCGGSGGGAANLPASIFISPGFAFVAQNDSYALTAQVTGLNNSQVVWAATGGTITATGPTSATFTASSQTGTYQITATSQQNPAIRATATVEVATPGVALHVGSSTIVTGASTDVTASVIGMDDQRVTWSVSGGTFVETAPGSIRYTAPEQPGSYTVTAQSVADPSKSSTATIEVVERLAVVTGRIRAKRDPRVGVPGVEVVFFDDAGAEVGRAITASDGSFVDELPMTATRFHLVPGSVPGTYFNEYTYGTLIYDADLNDCKAPLPDLWGRLEVSLPNQIVLTERVGRAPVPNGCS